MDKADAKPVCGDCIRAATPWVLWGVLELIERIVEPIYRKRREAALN